MDIEVMKLLYIAEGFSRAIVDKADDIIDAANEAKECIDTPRQLDFKAICDRMWDSTNALWLTFKEYREATALYKGKIQERQLTHPTP